MNTVGQSYFLDGYITPVWHCPECNQPVLTRAKASIEEIEARIEFHEFIMHGIGDRSLPWVEKVTDITGLDKL